MHDDESGVYISVGTYMNNYMIAVIVGFCVKCNGLADARHMWDREPHNAYSSRCWYHSPGRCWRRSQHLPRIVDVKLE
jgi:hypothetical protein